jgi:hypothetical protein
VNHTATTGVLAAFRQDRDPGPLVSSLIAAGAVVHLDQGWSPQGHGTAIFAGPGTHRLLLTRHWGDPGEPWLTVVALNPSTAGATVPDPTITRCVKRAARARFGGLAVVNLFSLISPDPAILQAHPDPVGPGNDAVIRTFCQAGEPVVCAWGDGGTLGGRAAKVTAMLRAAGADLLCLGVTGKGQPKHPGRLGYAEPIRPWAPR